jgi:hypothetical protein
VDTIHDEGWIKLYRKSIDSQAFQSEGLWKVWAWCLMRANYKDTCVPVKTGRGTTQVFVKRGQFIFGRKTASKELKMKPTTVNYRMQKLRDMQNLDIKTDRHYSIVTVRNYNLYQSEAFMELTTNLTTNCQPTDTDKNYKKEKNNIGRSKKQSDPRVKEFLNYWGETFQRETGQPYVFSFGKDGNLIKNLLAVHDLSTLQDLTKTFFKDEQCKRRGLTIGIFYQEINRLLSLKVMNPLEQAKREWAMQRGEKGNGISS